MTLIQTFHGTASNGTPLTAVYAEQPAAAAAFALVFPGSDLPRFVHWGRPLTAPETVINTFDALAPQRVSGGPRLHRMAERAADTVRSVVRL